MVSDILGTDCQLCEIHKMIRKRILLGCYGSGEVMAYALWSCGKCCGISTPGYFHDDSKGYQLG